MFYKLPFLALQPSCDPIYDERMNERTGVCVGGRPYRLRQRGLRCLFRRGSGRDSVREKGRGDRIYLLGLHRVRVSKLSGV